MYDTVSVPVRFDPKVKWVTFWPRDYGSGKIRSMIISVPRVVSAPGRFGPGSFRPLIITVQGRYGPVLFGRVIAKASVAFGRLLANVWERNGLTPS